MYFLLAVMLVPATDQARLLETFRKEFIAVTPGEGRFPKSFTMGSEKKGEGE